MLLCTETNGKVFTYDECETNMLNGHQVCVNVTCSSILLRPCICKCRDTDDDMTSTAMGDTKEEAIQECLINLSINGKVFGTDNCETNIVNILNGHQVCVNVTCSHILLWPCICKCKDTDNNDITSTAMGNTKEEAIQECVINLS